MIAFCFLGVDQQRNQWLLQAISRRRRTRMGQAPLHSAEGSQRSQDSGGGIDKAAQEQPNRGTCGPRKGPV